MGLVREYLGTAYACANLNANLVASTPLRLYLKSRRGDKPSRLRARGETRSLNHKALHYVRKVAAQQTADADEVEEVKSHPILDLITRPNPNEDGIGISGFTLFQLTQAYQEVVGRCYWYIERDGIGGTPTALWVLMPQLMTQIPGAKGEPLVKEYQFSGGGINARFQPDEIVPWRMLDLWNGYTGGMSPLRACYEEVRLLRDAMALSGARLKNSGKPDAMFAPTGNTSENFIGSVEAKRLAAQFRQSFSRAGNGGIMVSEQPGTLTPLSWPMNEIIDAVTLGLKKTDICNAFAVPDTKLNRNDANLAAAKTGDYAHARDAGLPRLRCNEAALNQFLIPMYGTEAAERLFFAYDEPEGLQDAAFEFEQTKAAASSGAVTRNEQRQILGLEPQPWGDQPTIDKNQVEVDAATGIPKTPVPTPTQPGKDLSVDDSAKTIAVLDAVKSLGKRIGQLDKRTRRLAKGGTAVDTVPASLRHTVSDDRISDGGAVQVINPLPAGSDRAYPSGERIAHGVRAVFAHQRATVLAAIQSHRSKAVEDTEDDRRRREEEAMLLLLLTWDFDTEQWNESVATATVNPYTSIVTSQGMQLISQIGQAVPELNMRHALAELDRQIPATAERLAGELGPQINATTTTRLQEGIARVRDAAAAETPRIPGTQTPTSESPAESPVEPAVEPVVIEPVAPIDIIAAIEAVVAEVFDDAEKMRAEKIGENEAVKATSAAEKAAVKTVHDQDIELEKRWRCQPGACDQCVSYEAMGWIPAESVFDDAVAAPPDPHNQCRCDLEYREVKDAT